MANGVATLDGSGKVPAAQLPSFVDDVIEVSTLANFPVTGESGKIYVALNTNKAYRWSGSTYVYITSGAVDSVAGKTGVISLVKGDVGLGSVDNTADSAKPVSTAQAAAIATVQTQVTGLSTSKADLLLVKNRKTANYTLAVTDSGKNVYFEGTGPYTLTVPKKTSVNIPQDTTITVINNTGNPVTVTFQTGVSYYINGNAVLATANAVLSPRSILVLLKTEDDIWYASGVAFA